MSDQWPSVFSAQSERKGVQKNGDPIRERKRGKEKKEKKKENKKKGKKEKKKNEGGGGGGRRKFLISNFGFPLSFFCSFLYNLLFVKRKEK